MGHTYTHLICHGVFSTKERKRFLSPAVMPELIKIAGGIIREREGKLIAMNGMEDHVHLLAVFHAKIPVSDMFRDIKAITSDWMHERFPDMKTFAWQNGYSAFSVSKSNLDAVEGPVPRASALG